MPLPYEVNGLSAACRYCGLQIAVSGAGAAVPNPYEAVCGSCIAEPMFDACVAACSYDYPVDQLIPALKFQRRRSVAKLLGGLLACSAQVRIDAGVVSCPDLLLPVPLHPCRLYSRAYNQAVEIASCIKLNDGALPVRAGYCSRIRSTPAQSGLSGRARRSNLRGAFSVSSRVLRRGLLEGRTVAMVDDVMTTGSTLQEFASVLRAAGAREVQAWVVARVM